MLKKMTLSIFVIALITSCNVKQTKEGELPTVDVDIDTEAGKLPEYDVDWAEVNVGTRTTTIKVPKVVVVMEEEEVEIPYIDVDMPNADEKEERTIMVEAEVTDKEHSLEIKEIWATGKRLYVISELEEKEQSLGDKKLRISDQVTINAPDLDVKYYVIGERPGSSFNTRHKFLKSTEALKAQLKDYKVIYSK